MGGLDSFHSFLNDHGLLGFIEESCIRAAYPQMLHDVDIACREGFDPLGNQRWGIFPWTASYSPFAPFSICANGGDPFIAREGLSLKDRNRPGAEASQEDWLDETAKSVHSGSGTSDRVFTPPTSGQKSSRALRPLVLKSGATTLLVVTDPFDDVGTVTHYQDSYTPQRDNARNKIWVLALRSGLSSPTVSPLSSLTPSSSPFTALASLSSDLRFKEVDDNLAIGSQGPALRFRKGFFGLTDPLATWATIALGPSAYENSGAVAPVAIDPVWSVDAGGAMKTPTIDLPSTTGCNGSSWTSNYVVDLGSLEYEFTMRPQMYTRIRQAHVGVGGSVTGVGLSPSGSTDKFLIAYHRAVSKKIDHDGNQHTFSEHFGPGEDAKGSSSELTWSARYGDHYRKVPVGQSSPTNEPLKYEIVLVDLSVTESGSSLSVTAGAPSVLATTGDFGSGTGASALDPILAKNDHDDVAILYRKVQDPYFNFKQIRTEGEGSQKDILCGDPLQCAGTCTSGSSPQTMLPTQASSEHVKWSASMSHSSAAFHTYPAILAMRFRWAGATSFGAEQVVSEPFKAQGTSGNSRFADDWAEWHRLNRNFREYGGSNYFFLDPTDPNPPSGYATGWLTDRPVTSSGGAFPLPKVPVGDPHTWNHAFPTEVVLGPRITEGSSTTTPILAIWKQMPLERRHDFLVFRTVPEWPSYAVYALRLSGDSDSNLTIASTTNYERFGSHEGMGPGSLTPVQNAWITTWAQPAVSFAYKQSAGGGTAPEEDTGDLLAFWQQEWKLHRQTEGQAQSGQRPPEYAPGGQGQLGASDHAILYAPKTGYEARNSSHTSALRITAWCKPNGQKTKIRYQWQKGGTTSSSDAFLPQPGASPADFETTDPCVTDVQIVAVIPWVRNIESSTSRPVGRIVWQADRDLWMSEIYYGDSSYPAHRTMRMTKADKRDPPQGSTTNTLGKYPVHLTEVSVAGDVIVWTYDGQIHAVRVAELQ